MRARHLSWALVIPWFAACTSFVSVEPLAPSPRPLVARPPDTVEMYVTEAPPRRYLEIAELRSSGASLAELRAEAARIGCDAVVIVEPSRQHAGAAYHAGKIVPVTVRSDTVATCAIWMPEVAARTE